MNDEFLQMSNELNDDMVDFCQKLLKVPALTGQEKNLADLYLKELQKLGYDECFIDDWGNVVGIIKGNQPGPTIMYNGHLDHVDTGDISDWKGYDPYGGVIDTDDMYDQDMKKLESTKVIHGRAAADVKSGCACMVYAGYALKLMRDEGKPLYGNYLLTLVVLEEPGEQLGMIKLCTDTLLKRNISFDAVISCEATSLKLYLGHRGRVELRVTISGLTSHGSSPWLGINAVNRATRLIDLVEKYVLENKLVDPDVGRSSIALTNITCTPGSMCIVPDRCYINYDRRFVPGESVESCLEQIRSAINELKAEDPDYQAKVEIAAFPRSFYTGQVEAVPNVKQAWKLNKQHPVTLACKTALENVDQTCKYGYWDFGTDLSFVSGVLKKPALGYSPMQEYYCHRPVDKCRLDFMFKALAGYISIHSELSRLKAADFSLEDSSI